MEYDTEFFESSQVPGRSCGGRICVRTLKRMKRGGESRQSCSTYGEAMPENQAETWWIAIRTEKACSTYGDAMPENETSGLLFAHVSSVRPGSVQGWVLFTRKCGLCNRYGRNGSGSQKKGNMEKNTFRKVLSVILMSAFSVFGTMALIKKNDSVYRNEPEQKNPMEGKKVVFVRDGRDELNADGARGHLKAEGESGYCPGFYERFIKRFMDIILSFTGLVLLSPVFVIIMIRIKMEDPGPAIFVQKRVGRNKQYFKLHKFRTMKMAAPHDVPTHMLACPQQYITRTGRFMRRHSIDELVQLWDIFLGNMSVIGPRPALWNQDVLIAERDKWGANDIKPGLSGWAQINGRDELEIPVKAGFDGEYATALKQGGIRGLKMDIRCFLGSLRVVAGDRSVVEGGTGAADPDRTGCAGVDGTSGKEVK